MEETKMAEEIKDTVVEPAAEPAGEATEPEKTYTKKQLDAIVERQVKKATSGMFSADEIADRDNNIKTLTSERDTAKAQLQQLQAELNASKQEKLLIGYGVTQEDAEYYAYKIGKLVTDKKTFEQAAEEYFKANPIKKARVDLAAPVGGGKGNASSNTTNDLMNDLIRQARK